MGNDEKKKDLERENLEKEETQESEVEKEEKKESTAEETYDKKDVPSDKIEKLKSELSKQKDIFVRLAAEYENFRKRSLKEKDAIYNNAVSKTVEIMLPVMDSLEFALQSQEGADDEYKKGLEMIKNQFKAAFDKLGVEAIGEKGDEFDPNFHNAVLHEENDSIADNTITEVLQKGYILGDRVIRPAMVKVAN